MSSPSPIPTFQQDKVVSLFKIVVLLFAAMIGIWLVWALRQLLWPLLFAATISIALAPEIDIMERKGSPRWLSVLVIYLLFISLAVVLAMVVSENVGGQIKDLGAYLASRGQSEFSKLQDVPASAGRIMRDLHMPPAAVVRMNALAENAPNQLTAYLSNYLIAFGEQIPAMAGNLLDIIIVPILAYYFLVDYHQVLGKILLFVRPDRREQVLTSLNDIVVVFGQYVRGIVFMVLIDIAVIYAVLRIMHVKYPETVALIAGVLYAVPYLGAMISTVLIGLMTWLSLNLGKAVIVLVIMILIHQLLFDQIVAPRIIGKQVDLHPLIAFLAMLIGGTLFGVPGTLLAVPIAAASRIILIRLYPRLQEQYTGATTVEQPEPLPVRRRTRRAKTPPQPPADAS